MFKKFLALLLAIVICIWSVGVFAKNDLKNGAGTRNTVTLKGQESEEADTDTEVDEDEEVDEGEAADKDKEAKERNKKAEITKEKLKERIQMRNEALIEAKEYIKEIKGLFKEADVSTRKEILSEISQIKKELKEYSIGAFVRGFAVDFDKYDGVKPVIEQGRTLVPVRAVSETLGATVEWVEETKSIIISKDNNVIVMQLDNKTAYVNEKECELEVAPTTIKGRTIVPIRFIAEALNLTVEWDDDSQTVIVD